MRLNKNGKPSRAWRALTSRDPRKKVLTDLVKAAAVEQDRVAPNESLRLTNMRIRDGVAPVLVQADVLSYGGPRPGRATRQGSYIRRGTIVTAVFQRRPGEWCLHVEGP